MIKTNYNSINIKESLDALGIKKGDDVFIHSNIALFGVMEFDSDNLDLYPNVFFITIMDVIGEEGTLIVPTFTYSFMKKETFDPRVSSSNMGMFSEYVRKLSNTLRSLDPNFSIAAIGKNAGYYTTIESKHSFDKNSFFDKFFQRNGIFINMNLDAGTTFVHYIEKTIEVPYRFDKEFCGAVNYNNEVLNDCFTHFVYDHSKIENTPDFSRIEPSLISKGLLNVTKLGLGRLISFSSVDYFYSIVNDYILNPSFLIKGKSNDSTNV